MSYTFVATDKLRAPLLRGLIPSVTALPSKAAVVSSVVWVELPAIAAQMDPLTLYALDGYIAYSSGGTTQLDIALTAPPSAQGEWALNTTGTTAVVEAPTPIGLAGFQSSPGGTSPTQRGFTIAGWVKSGLDGGAIRIEMAQNISDAVETSLYAGSYLRLHKVA